MNTLNELKSIQQSLDKVIGYLEQAVDTPEPQIPITEPEPPFPSRPPTQQPSPIDPISSLFSDPKRWEEPKKVSEFESVAEGGFAPLTHDTFLQQERWGGKIRYISPDKQKNAFVYYNGYKVEAYLQDAVMDRGDIVALFKYDDTIVIANCSDTDDDKLRFDIISDVTIKGKKDTSHGLMYDNGLWSVFGRVRGEEWGANNRTMYDRRGIKVYESTGLIDWTKTHIIDPAIEQQGYEHDDIRFDYYSCKGAVINGTKVLAIGCFRKDANRVPSTEPDKITGTGAIYPIFMVNGNIIAHEETIVPLHLHERRTEWPESHAYEPEVGQLYPFGFAVGNGKVSFFYCDRPETHYLINEKTAKNLPNCTVWRIEATL